MDTSYAKVHYDMFLRYEEPLTKNHQ